MHTLRTLSEVCDSHADCRVVAPGASGLQIGHSKSLNVILSTLLLASNLEGV